MTGTVTVTKEFIHKYHQVVDKLGYQAMLDEEFYPKTVDDVKTVIEDYHSLADLFQLPSPWLWSKEDFELVKQSLLEFLINQRTNSKKLIKYPYWQRPIKQSFVDEWNMRIDNFKPLPSKFNSELLEYFESITLDLVTFQSMQKVIVDNTDILKM